MSSLVRDAADYGSNFGDEDDVREREKSARKRRLDNVISHGSKAKVHHAVFSEEVAKDEGRRQRHKFLALNAYDRHKLLVNNYLLNHPDDVDKVLKRDTSGDRSDADLIRQNHRFLWDRNQDPSQLTWEQRLARKYWEKLFHEYCICDLSRYKENKVAMRFQTEAEVRKGKGQFVCGAKKCEETQKMRTWEVNFAYVEEGEKKNALVKLRLCPECSYKLNYHHQKKEVRKSKKSKKKRKKSKKRKRSGSSSDSGSDDDDDKDKEVRKEKEEERQASEIWKEPVSLEQEKSREEDFDDYLADMFL